MIYDVRTYDVRPHCLPEVERRLEGACTDAVRRGELVASFQTEIGPLNQVIQIRAVADDGARERSHAGAAAVTAALGELLVAERAEEFVPFPFVPAIEPGSPGPFFEIRQYRYAPGHLEHIRAAWEEALPTRLALGPIVTVASSAPGGSDSLFHIWPYHSLDERWALRRTIREAGDWPPHVVAARLGMPGFELLEMENKIAVASSFSPLQ